MTKKCLRVPKRLVSFLAEGELDGVALGCEWSHLRPWLFNWPRGQLIRGPRHRIREQRRGWRRNRGNTCRLVFARKALRQDCFDLSLCLASGGGQQIVRVFRSQVSRQQCRTAEMKPAIGNGIKQGRTLTSLACHSYPLERGVLRQSQHNHTVRMHRSMRRREEQPARIDLREVREQVGSGGAVLRHMRCEIPQQHLVIEMGKCVSIHSSPARASAASGRGGDE